MGVCPRGWGWGVGGGGWGHTAFNAHFVGE